MYLFSCHLVKKCLSLAYDELAYLIASGCLDERLVMWIKEKFAPFADIYLCDADDAGNLQTSAAHLDGLPIEIWMHLDEPVR